LTLQQGSIISSLAATLATEPLTTLLRYTIGVLPMSCDLTVNRQNKMLMYTLLIATRCVASIDQSSAISKKNKILTVALPALSISPNICNPNT
jgi:hypothetical protein